MLFVVVALLVWRTGAQRAGPHTPVCVHSAMLVSCRAPHSYQVLLISLSRLLLPMLMQFFV
jgi:hypothetical protein